MQQIGVIQSRGQKSAMEGSCTGLGTEPSAAGAIGGLGFEGN